MNTNNFLNISVKDRKGRLRVRSTAPFSSLTAYSRCKIVSQDSSIELPKRPSYISKFKYTGQEEDKESGLMYYKARYYYPALGRFLQADSVVTDSIFGYNRYMYVEGRPVNFSDSIGNKKNDAILFTLAVYFYKDTIKQNGINPYHVLFAGVYAVNGGKNPIKDMTGGAKWASKGLERAFEIIKIANGKESNVERNKKVKWLEQKDFGLLKYLFGKFPNDLRKIVKTKLYGKESKYTIDNAMITIGLSAWYCRTQNGGKGNSCPIPAINSYSGEASNDPNAGQENDTNYLGCATNGNYTGCTPVGNPVKDIVRDEE